MTTKITTFSEINAMKHNIYQTLRIFSLTMVALTMAACQEDGDTVSLNVEIDQFANSHKTYIDSEHYTCWTNGDNISINGVSHPIVIDGDRCRVNNIATQNTYTAVTPASLTTSTSTVQNQVISGLRLPASYTYPSTTVPVVMAAYLNAPSGTIRFHNACIVLQLNIANNYSRTLRLADIRVSDNLAPLSGMFDISGLDNEAPALMAQSGNDTTHSVTLLPNADNPVDLATSTYTTVYVVLPPTDAYQNNKFTITINAVDYLSATEGTIIQYQFQHQQSTEAMGNIPRNTMLPISISLDSPHTTVLHGLGTETTPYLIQQREDLYAMSRLVNSGFIPVGLGEPFASAYYQLNSDLSLSTSDPALEPIGNALNNFTGHFDGGLHRISNLHVAGDECAGLFGHISNGATLKRTVLENIHLSATADNAMVGALCGHADRSVIDRCAIEGSASITCSNATVAYIGGIVGNLAADRKDASFLYNCYNSCQLTVSGSGNYQVGGIAGRMFNSTILNAYIQSAQISTTNASVGGIASRTDGESSIINCYTGNVNTTLTGAAGRVGDICSSLGSNSQLVYCYYPSMLYATGNPSSDQLSNNNQYISYNSAYGDGAALADLLQYYVDHISRSSTFSLCSWTTDPATNAPVFNSNFSK